MQVCLVSSLDTLTGLPSSKYMPACLSLSLSHLSCSHGGGVRSDKCSIPCLPEEICGSAMKTDPHLRRPWHKFRGNFLRVQLICWLSHSTKHTEGCVEILSYIHNTFNRSSFPNVPCILEDSGRQLSGVERPNYVVTSLTSSWLLKSLLTYKHAWTVGPLLLCHPDDSRVEAHTLGQFIRATTREAVRTWPNCSQSVIFASSKAPTYLASLCKVDKWQQHSCNITVGDLVLIRQEGLEPTRSRPRFILAATTLFLE